MNFTLNKTVYCHDITHPPKEHRGNDIYLIFNGSDSMIHLRRIPQSHRDKSFVTQYSMVIFDPLSVGFTSDDRNTIDRELRNLLLAFNLLLCRVCILGTYTSFSDLDIEPDIPESQSHVDKIGNRYEVHLSESITVRNNIFAEIGVKDSVDDKQVVNLFNKLQRSKRFEPNPNSTKQEVNLDKSLSEYEQAMSNFEIDYKFKHLFNSLEYSTNINGEKLRYGFDSFYTDLVKSPSTDVTQWRTLYNRTKHVQENSNHVKAYIYGLQSSREYVLELRKSCRDMILRRVHELDAKSAT